MKLEQLRRVGSPEVSSKAKLVLGAAGLLLFIVGVRKTFHPEGKPGEAGAPDRPVPPEQKRE